MTTANRFQNHSARKVGATRLENLLKNTDFSAGFEHWVVTDFGNPENCTIQGHVAVLKNNGSIAQSVTLQPAAPYTLRFEASSNGIAQVLEDGEITHTIYVSGGDYKHSFVTRERTTSVEFQFTGVSERQFFVFDILLTKDVPDPEELVKNGDFDFDGEDWQTSQHVVISDGLCRITNPNGHASQQIGGLVPGATYRISCATVPYPPFYFGGVFIVEGEGHLQVIELKADVYEYFYDYQATSESFSLHLEGFWAAYDSVSIKRVSVGK